jgi:hypothetical protein
MPRFPMDAWFTNEMTIGCDARLGLFQWHDKLH